MPDLTRDEAERLLDELIDTCKCARPACEAKHAKARAAVIAAMTRAQWQDISTAPKDNRSRLVWCPLDKCIYCVSWVDNSQYPPAQSGWQVFGGNEIIDGVTHWQPLPAAPEAPK